MSDAFIRKIFSKYYQQAEFDISRIDQREFGIGNSKKIEARHLSFVTSEQFRTFLVSNTPRFVSHSAAYYRYPSATPQDKKVRLGADLIFDLDLHGEGKYGVYSLLDSIKADVIRLAEDFLLRDFGISRQELLIVFSGNRGYHIHVRDEAFAQLGTDERREITNYIRGEGLDTRRFFDWQEIAGGKRQVLRKLFGPKPTDSGYRGRLAQLTIKLLESEPTKISKVFAKQEKRDFFISGIKQGDWSRTSLKLENIPERIAPLREQLIVRSVNADPAVTYDMSKLIRVPNSIHGDTGFVAKIVADVDSFEPLKHAVINGPAVSIRFSEAVPQIQMLNQTFGPFEAAQKAELPLGAAIFFMLKESAELV